MKNMFNMESPFFQLLSRVADMIAMNVVFLICCLPVVTVGPAIAALNKVFQNMVMEDDRGVFSQYIRAFKENFKQSFLTGLAMLVVIASLVCDYLLIITFCEGSFATVMKVLLVILVCLVTGVLSFLFPLMVRYANTVREHLYNAIILAVCKLPRTIAMVFLNLLPLLLFYISPGTFIKTLIFWVAIGFAFVCFMDSLLIKPVFRELEKVNNGEGSVGIMN